MKQKTFIPIIAILGCLLVQASCFATESNARARVDSKTAKQSYDRGREFESEADWRSALDAFLATVKAQPKSAAAWIELGRSYLELHDYTNAERCFRHTLNKLAVDGDPLRTCLQGLIYCESKNGELEALQQTRRIYVENFPRASESKMLSEEINYYDNDFVETRRMEATGARAPLFRSWIGRFRMPEMPIRVSVEQSKSMLPGKLANAESSVRYAAIAKKAFLTWSSAADRKLVFVLVNEPRTAQINLEWTNNPKEKSQSFVAGHCQTIREGNSIRSEKQRPLVFVGKTGAATDAEFYDICLHEIGHALGLQHSSHPGDIMYHSEGAHALSKSDIQQLKAIYVSPFEAAKVALEFANAAFVDQDYETAYQMLSVAEKKNKTLEQFQQALIDQDKGPKPDTVAIHQLYTDLRHQTNFILSGRNQKNERSYFLVQTAPMPDGTFQITGGSRDN